MMFLFSLLCDGLLGRLLQDESRRKDWDEIVEQLWNEELLNDFARKTNNFF